MQIIDNLLLDDLSGQAAENQRLRMNLNFHAAPESPSQRLLNALEPGTVVPVHRHRHTDETYILLRGCIRVMEYNDQKELLSEHLLEPSKGRYGINIPAGSWHSLEVLEAGSVILECKDGPYTPLTASDLL